MGLYTKSGDNGETGLFGGGRVSKDHDRVAACGDLDELNAAIGVAEAACQDDALSQQLRSVQADLFLMGSQLASDASADVPRRIDEEAIDRLERWIDAASAEAPPLGNFILPGGGEVAARLHLTRTVCRRVERSVVRLMRGSYVEPSILVYLNRLGDLLFALARTANQRAGVEDITWSPP